MTFLCSIPGLQKNLENGTIQIRQHLNALKFKYNFCKLIIAFYIEVIQEK